MNRASGGPEGRPSPPATPVEGVRSEHPEDPAWRADALAASRHSRLVDELQEPLESHDTERATSICAAVTRLALRDFAPALILLPPAERRRAQTLAAFSLTLFDFARQNALEGERFSQLNRWEFNLEAALEGRPAGQPVFVLIDAEERRAPWSREGFQRLMRCARRRVAIDRPPTVAAAELQARELGDALATTLLASHPPPHLGPFAGALLRVRALQDLGDHLRRHRPPLAVEELPDGSGSEKSDAFAGLAGALGRECGRLRPLLQLPAGEQDLLAPVYRPGTAFLRLAALRLLTRIETLGARVVEAPPCLGLPSRLALLLRARLLG